MRIQSDGEYEFRKALYDDIADLFGENARSKGIDASCEFSRRMLANLERAVEHEDMTEDLAEVLSTPRVQLRYEVETDVRTPE